jgi:hypothetical protein
MAAKRDYEVGNETVPSAPKASHQTMIYTKYAQEKAPAETPEFPPAPEGGTRAWLVAGGGAAIFFCTLGFSNTFGTFEQYYLTHQLQSQSASQISWIGSLSAFLQFFAGMVGGPLFDRFGARVCLSLG